MIISKRKIHETLTMLLEAKSNIDFLEFVIKWYSEDENNWLDEWEYIGCYRQPAQCICGKEDLATVFIIQNKINKLILSPIGSVCIQKFLPKAKANNILNNIKNGLLGFLSRNSLYWKRNIAMTTEFFTKENIKTFLKYNIINEEEVKICVAALNKRYATVDQYQKGASIIVNKIVAPLKASLNKAIQVTTATPDSIYFTDDRRVMMESLYDNFYKGKTITTKAIKALVLQLFPPRFFSKI